MNFASRLRAWRMRTNLSPPKLLMIGSIAIYLGFIGYWMNKNPESVNLAMTRTVGKLSSVKIPRMFRNFILKRYCDKYEVNMNDLQKPLIEYETFSEFFTRKIKQRAINPERTVGLITSPAQCQILNISQVVSNSSVIAKGITYSLTQLIFQEPDGDILKSLKQKEQSKLYQVIMYLAPGDYHRFHCPIKAKVKAYRQIKGSVYPVNLKALSSVGKKIYEKNARKILHCNYNPLANEGDNFYLGLVLIGALNVSDIQIEMKKSFEQGEQMGYFNLGSTIVMLVQAKQKMEWLVSEGDKITYGQPLCQVAASQM